MLALISWSPIMRILVATIGVVITLVWAGRNKQDFVPILHHQYSTRLRGGRSSSQLQPQLQQPQQQDNEGFTIETLEEEEEEEQEENDLKKPDVIIKKSFPELRFVTQKAQQQRKLPELVGLGGQPDISHFPLQQCEGDCDQDNDCDVGLECRQRQGGEEVLGCSGLTSNSIKTDYCVVRIADAQTNPSSGGSNNAGSNNKQPPGILTLIGNNQNLPPSGLSLCQGDCDSDSDCKAGLMCFQRNANDAVPGCVGDSGKGSRTDFCVWAASTTDTTSTGPTWTPTIAWTWSPTFSPTVSPTWSPTSPPSIVFTENAADSPTKTLPPTPPSTDPPTPPPLMTSPPSIPPTMPPTIAPVKGQGVSAGGTPLPKLKTVGNNNEFSVFPLLNCMGDCDTDSDCAVGLICHHRTATQPVPGCSGSGDFSVDYCIYRSSAASVTAAPAAAPVVVPTSTTAQPMIAETLAPSTIVPTPMISTALPTESAPPETGTSSPTTREKTVESPTSTTAQPLTVQTLAPSTIVPTRMISTASPTEPAPGETVTSSPTIVASKGGSTELPTEFVTPIQTTMVPSEFTDTVPVSTPSISSSSTMLPTTGPGTKPLSLTLLPTEAAVTGLPTTISLVPTIGSSRQGISSTGGPTEESKIPATPSPSMAVPETIEPSTVSQKETNSTEEATMENSSPTISVWGSESPTVDSDAAVAALEKDVESIISGRMKRSKGSAIEGHAVGGALEKDVESLISGPVQRSKGWFMEGDAAEKDAETLINEPVDRSKGSLIDKNLMLIEKEVESPPSPSSTLPSLTMVGEKDKFLTYPLGLCQGSCQNDHDCMAGLECFTGERGGDIPGCEGTGDPTANYCVHDLLSLLESELLVPQGTPSTLPYLQLLGADDVFEAYPLGVCQGSCFDDFDCLGNLKCFHRDGDEVVPGCQGTGPSSANYCIPSVLYALDDEAAPQPHEDIEEVLPNLQLLGADGVFDMHPLGACQGSCSNDLDCSLGLSCFVRLGDELVPGCGGSGHTGMNYCILTSSEELPQRSMESTESATVMPSQPPSKIAIDVSIAPTASETESNTETSTLVEPEPQTSGTGVFSGSSMAPSSEEASTQTASTSVPTGSDTQQPSEDAKAQEEPAGDALLLSSFEATTLSPSGIQTISESESVLPKLQIVGNDEIFDIYPLTVCKGDCDVDKDCARGLRCFQRRGFETVPGCDNTTSGEYAADYCVEEQYFVYENFNWTGTAYNSDDSGDNDGQHEEEIEDQAWESETDTTAEEFEWGEAEDMMLGSLTLLPTQTVLSSSQSDKPTAISSSEATESPSVAPSEDSTGIPTQSLTSGTSSEGITGIPTQPPTSGTSSEGITGIPTQSVTASPTTGPIDIHTAVPSESGSSSQVLASAFQAKPPLTVIFDPIFPLLECQGDCNNHNDCAPGLFCFHRNSDEMPVPGCLVGPAPLSTDYCISRSYWANGVITTGQNTLENAEEPIGFDDSAIAEAEAEDAAWEEAEDEISSGFASSLAGSPTEGPSGMWDATAAIKTGAPTASSSTAGTLPPTESQSIAESESSTLADSSIFQTHAATTINPSESTASPTMSSSMDSTLQTSSGETLQPSSASADSVAPSDNPLLTLLSAQFFNPVDTATDSPTAGATQAESMKDSPMGSSDASFEEGESPLPKTESPTTAPHSLSTVPATTQAPSNMYLSENLTSSPTAAPTYKPYFMPNLHFVGNDGVFETFPLRECHGDCDSNEDCEGELMCMQRIANESVPGCRGYPEFSVDYCVKADYLLTDTFRRSAPNESHEDNN